MFELQIAYTLAPECIHMYFNEYGHERVQTNFTMFTLYVITVKGPPTSHICPIQIATQFSDPRVLRSAGKVDYTSIIIKNTNRQNNQKYQNVSNIMAAGKRHRCHKLMVHLVQTVLP